MTTAEVRRTRRPESTLVGRDLRPTPNPVASPADWADPEAVLLTLYRRVEQKAIDANDWYLRDKRIRKRASQLLRAAAILLAAGGGLLPLIAATRSGSEPAGWGYVLLGAAAACVAFDRFFGLSAAWMRDILGSQQVQRRLEVFQHDWTAACAAGTSSIDMRLALLRAFAEDTIDLVQRETSEWQTEFQSNLAHLEKHAGGAGTATTG